MSFINDCDSQLYHIMHFDTALRDSSIYSFCVSKQSSLFCCTRQCQDINFNFTAAHLRHLWPRLCCGPTKQVEVVNLLKVSARYSSCRNRETSEKQLANGVSVSDRKITVAVSSSAEAVSGEPYHETANKLRYD